jgi:replicative DNA helicase
VPHRSNEGATEFMARVVKVFPTKEQELAMITGDYEQLRYGGVEDENRVRRYMRAVRRFKVK